jgi:hypothetical protein
MVFGKILLSLTAFMLLFGTVSAFPFTATINGPHTVSLVEGTSMTIPLDINNLDYQKHEIKITADSETNFVKVTPAKQRFVLNQYQATAIGLELNVTDDASHELFVVEIEIDADGQKTVLPVNVYVGTNPILKLNSFENSVCGNDYYTEVSASVKNSTSEDKEVFVRIEQSALVPSVTPYEFTLEGGETQFLDIGLNVSPKKEGDFEGTIFAYTDDLAAARPFTVHVNNCPEAEDPVISLKVPAKKIDFPKLQTTNAEVTVKNLTNELQDVTLTGYGEIASGIIHVQIGPNENADIAVPFTPGLHVKTGEQLVEITAFSGSYRTTKSFEVNVLPIDYLETEFVENIFEIEEGKERQALLLISNKGDTAQEINVRMRDSTPEVSYLVSDEEFELETGESKLLVISVLVENNSYLVRVNNAVIIAGKEEQHIPFLFNVLRPVSSDIIPLEFVSFPEKIEMNQNENKSIFVSLHNPSEKTISDISFRLLGVGNAGLHLIPVKEFDLLPLETKTVEVQLVSRENIKPAVYNPIITADSEGATASQSFTVEVIGNDFGFFTGLAAGIGKNATPLGAVVLFLIFLLWLGSRTNIYQKEPLWVSNKQK